MNPDTFFTKELYDRNWFFQHSALIETPIRNNSSVGTSTQLVRIGDQSKCMAMTDMPLDLSPQKNVFCNPLEPSEDGPLDLSLKTFRRSLELPHHVNAIERNLSNPVTSQLNASYDQSNRCSPSGTFGQYHHKLTKDGKFVLRQEAIVYGCAESLPATKYEEPFVDQSIRSMETIGSCKSNQLSHASERRKPKIKIGNTVNPLVIRTATSRKHSSKDVLNDAGCDSQFVHRYEHLPSPRCSPDSTNSSYAQLPSKSNSLNAISSFDSTCLILSSDAKSISTSTLQRSHTNTICEQANTYPSTGPINKMSTSIKSSNIPEIRQNQMTTKVLSTTENHFPAKYDSSNQINMTVSSHNISEENCRELPVSSKPIPSPLQISIPDIDAKPASKLCSRKHKILEAVSRDDRLRNIVSYDKFSKESSICNGKIYDTTDSSTRSSSFPDLETSSMTGNMNCPVSPASPVMPILSPQSRYPEPISSVSICEPPALDPAMTLADGDTVKAKTEDATFNKQEDANERSKANVACFETAGRSALFPTKRNIPVANVAPNVHLHDSVFKSDASEILSNISPEEKSYVKTTMSRNVGAKSCQANSTSCNKFRPKRKLEKSNEESVLSEQKSDKYSKRNISPSPQIAIASKKKRVKTNKDRSGSKNSRPCRQSVPKDEKKEPIKQGPQQNAETKSNRPFKEKVTKSIVIKSKMNKRVLSKRDLTLCKQDNISSNSREKQDIMIERKGCREIKKPRRSSMLGEIANSHGFVNELKQRRTSTGSLLVDPSLLSREEKALRRAMLEFSKLETRLHNQPIRVVKDNFPVSKSKEQTISSSPKACRKKQQDQLTDIRNDINHTAESSPRLQPRFADFQPLLLKSRTRFQAAGNKGLRKFNRNDAYDNELDKEESRNAMFRKQRRERFLQKLREAKAAGPTTANEAELSTAKVATAASTVAVTIDGSSVVSEMQVTKQACDVPVDNHNDGCWQIQTSPAPPPRPTHGPKKPGNLTLKLLWRSNDDDQVASWRSKKPTPNGYSQSSYQLVKKASMAGVTGRRGKLRKRVSGGRKYFSKQRRKQKIIHYTNGLDVASDVFSSNADLLSDNHLPECSFTSHSAVPAEVKRIMVNKNSGETLLHRAARQGYENVALYCLKNGSVDVNARDNAGFSALHDCCVHGNLKIARHLIQYGADVNCASRDGTRPLHDATDNNRHEIVRLLLSCEADPQLATYSGRTPLSMARTASMRQLLKGYLGDLNGLEDGQSEIPWQFKGSTDLSDSKDESGMDIFADVPTDAEDDDDVFDCQVSAQFQPYNIRMAPFDSLESFVLVDHILKQYPALSSSLGKVDSQLPVVTISNSAFLDGAKNSIYYPYLRKYCTATTEDIRVIRAEDVMQMEGKLKHMQETLDTFNQCSPDTLQDFHTNNDDFEFEVCSDVSYDLEVSSDGSVEYLGNVHSVSQATSGQNDEACFSGLTDQPMPPPLNSSTQVRRQLFGNFEHETVKIDSSKFQWCNDADKCFESEPIDTFNKTDFLNLDHWMVKTAEISSTSVPEHQAMVVTSNDVDPEFSVVMDMENSVRDNMCESKKLQRLQQPQEDMMPKNENSEIEVQTYSSLNSGDPFQFQTNPQEWFGVCKKESSECIFGDMTKSTTSVVLPKHSDSVLEW